MPKVLNGIWRTSDEARAADTMRIAENQRVVRELAVTEPIYAKLRPAMKAEDWTTALLAVEEGIALMVDHIDFRVIHANLLLHKMNDMRTGLPVLRQLVRDAIHKKVRGVDGYGYKPTLRSGEGLLVSPVYRALCIGQGFVRTHPGRESPARRRL
ncbi:hypothetical protein ACFIOY_18615 [Bradyrhizobium sp. TZ2]